jgi:hypothetical protein
MNSCKITYIYGLYEIGKEDEIRYIGKTDNPRKRIRDHKNDKRNTSYKSSWIKSVVSKGSDVGIKVLKVSSQELWKKVETETIKEYREKFNLVNLTDGGDGKMFNKYNKSFDECKTWLKLNKPEWVTRMVDYKKWSKMKKFPDFLPKAPDKVFPDWTYWGDYLGTGNIHAHNRKDIYLSYEEAKKYLKQNFNFKSSNDFIRCKEIPLFIPKKPYNIYASWNGWHDFLGYKPYRRTDNNYLKYEEAKKYIDENIGKITSKEYREMSKSNKLPIFLPKKPEKYYDNFTWGDYLSNNGRKKSKEFYMSYKESMEIVHTLNIKTNREWREWCKNKPKEFIRIPSSPDSVYKEEWTNWYDWLGN